MLKAILDEKKISLYQFEKMSGIPHATLNDIYHERSDINKCSISVIKKIATSLNMNIDQLYNLLNYDDLSLFDIDQDFDLFKSNICHELKKSNAINFIDKYLSNKKIKELYEKKQYKYSLYLLSMIDYLCAANNIPISDNYKEIRKHKLKKISIPTSVYMLLRTKQMKYSDIMKETNKSFYAHNIVESEIENVI